MCLVKTYFEIQDQLEHANWEMDKIAEHVVKGSLKSYPDYFFMLLDEATTFENQLEAIYQKMTLPQRRAVKGADAI